MVLQFLFLYFFSVLDARKWFLTADELQSGLEIEDAQVVLEMIKEVDKIIMEIVHFVKVKWT